jgi:thiol-disulfide isomerase/thioredoxin
VFFLPLARLYPMLTSATLLRCCCCLLLGLWSHLSQATLPDAVVRALPGTSVTTISYSTIYFAEQSGALRPGRAFPVHFGENSHLPTLLYFPAWKPSRKPGQRQPPPGQSFFKPPTLVLLPGDTVEIGFDERQYAFTFRGRHQAELDFCHRVWQSPVGLDGFFFEMSVPHSQVPLDQFLRDWHALKRTSEALIAELQHTPGIRPAVAALLSENLRLRSFYTLLLPASYQRPRDPLRVLTPAYVDSVTAASGILTLYQRRAPQASPADLTGALSAYAAYQCLRAGRQPIQSARYAMAKQLYQGFPRAWACYNILHEAQRRRQDIRRLLADYRSWVGPYTEFVRALQGDPTVPLRSYQREVFTDSLEAPAAPGSSLVALLRQYKGQVVLLDLWASWCVPCLAELPASAAVAQRYQARGLRVLYLSIDQDAAAWRKALSRLRGSPGQHLRFADPSQARFLQEFEVRTIPRYLVLDRTGAVRSPEALRPSDPRFAAFIERVLAQ